jgi:hypothetical protein
VKNSERLLEATAYADAAYAKLLDVSPEFVGFAMFNMDVVSVVKASPIPVSIGFWPSDKQYNRRSPLWSFNPATPSQQDETIKREKKERLAALSAAYAADPMGTGDSPYEHDFHPFELCAGIVDNCRNNALEIPEFITKLADTLLTK